MGTHFSDCERWAVVREVHKHINLSTIERAQFLENRPEDNLACNCRARRSIDIGVRDVRLIERMVTDAVLKARGITARQALGWQGKAEIVRSGVEGKGKITGQEAQIIRIDFRNRRRITE